MKYALLVVATAFLSACSSQPPAPAAAQPPASAKTIPVTLHADDDRVLAPQLEYATG